MYGIITLTEFSFAFFSSLSNESFVSFFYKPILTMSMCLFVCVCVYACVVCEYAFLLFFSSLFSNFVAEKHYCHTHDVE